MDAKRLFAACCVIYSAAALIVSGCSKQSTQNLPAPVSQHVANPSSFPLYQPSSVVSVAPFDQHEMAQAFNAKSQQGGAQKLTPYRGTEVLASTSASLSDLKSWMDSMRSAPPEQLRLTTAAHAGRQTLQLLDSWGADVAAFQSDGRNREVLVMVMDPQKVRDKLGMALGLIDKYEALPSFVRAPIDEKAKAQFGVSVTQMLDKNSPVGLFIGAVRDPALTGKRAIVVLDASKE